MVEQLLSEAIKPAINTSPLIFLTSEMYLSQKVINQALALVGE
ncbi:MULTISPECIES: hypothetical protein [unclassified Anabaena]|nr:MULTISPECIES: hypothetical protein [unclassified Anabaena]